MFCRVKSLTNKDGSKRNYLQIVENKREGGKVRQSVICSLGRLEEAQSGSLDSLVNSLLKFTKKAEILDAAKSLFADWSKEYGPAVVFRKLWETLNLDRIIKKLLADTEITSDIEEAIFCMVLNRLTDPISKLGVNSWKDGVCREGFENLKLHHFYRAIDFLDESKDTIEEKLFFMNTDLFSSQLDLVFFDTTSTYVNGGEGAVDLLEYGYSKDHRPDRLQVIIGVLISKTGLPIAHHVFPGNTSDTEAFRTAISDLRDRFHIGKVIAVGDRGMIGQKTLDLLDDLGIQYILGARMRNIKVTDKLLADKAAYTDVPGKDNLKVKEMTVDEGRYILCLNEKEVERDREVRQRIKDKLTEKLKSGNVKEFIGNREYKKYIQVDKDSARLNETKLKEEEKYDGLYIVKTNADQLSAVEIAIAYRDLWMIERAFRDMKSILRLRPIYHWTEKRINGHIVLCFLALVMEIRYRQLLAEQGTAYGYSDSIRELCKVHAVKLRINEDEFLVRTEVKGAATAAFRAVGAQIPESVCKFN